MEKIVFEGENYYYQNGVLYDSSYIEVSKECANRVLAEYFRRVDYKELCEKDLILLIIELKKAEVFQECLNIINYGAEKFYDSFNYFKVVFPIATSCYRRIGQSQKAIDFWMNNKSIFQQFASSVPLLTSLAAAYCDVGDYKRAKYCADRGYFTQGGGQGHKNELALVYYRIRKEAPELFDDFDD